MGMRRITSEAGNNTPEHPEKIVNGRTHVEPKRFLFFVCVLSISVALMFPRWASAQDPSECLPHCWKKQDVNLTLYDMTFKDGVHFETIVELQDCKDACFNNETCTGVYWGFQNELKITTCWLQMPVSGDPVTLKNGNHWYLTACSDDCSPYCWKPKLVNFQTTGGTYQQGVNNEDQCKLLCSKDQSCNGVDWNATEPSCWFLLMTDLTTRPLEEPIRHWEIKRNLPIICEKETLVPSTIEATTVPATEPMSVGTTPAAPPSANTVEANTPPVAGTSAGESSLDISSTPGGLASVGPNVGESNIGNGPAPARSAVGVPPGATPKLRKCPNYMKGIIALAVLMGVLGLIIIGLLANILSIRREQAKTDNLFSVESLLGYQSIGGVPDTAEGFEAETAYRTT